jgi:hypothetical protein
MQSLVTPGAPGYRPPRRSLYDRLFKKNQNQPFDPLDPDKEEFPIERQEVNLENYAINNSFNEEPLSIYDEMSDVSSVNSDQILQEAQDIQNKFSPYNPPNADFLESDGDSFLFNPDSDTSFEFNLPNRLVRKLDREKNLKDYPSLKDYYEEMERTKPPPFKENFSYKNVEDLENALKMDNLALKKPNPVLNLPNAKTITDDLNEAAQARLARQNSLQQPYPQNWNPQANTRANRAWGAQNIANMEAEMAQEQARISGLGTAARNAQAAEALPGAAARARSMFTRFGEGVSKIGEGLSNFSARALPIINLGLLGYGLYNQAKNNRENERYRKMIEGNQI